MSERPSAERKWKMNAKKVAFAKTFPGRLPNWEAASGKTIDRVLKLEKENMEMVLFSDATFVLTPDPDAKPALLIQALLQAKPFLEKYYAEAYLILDDLIASDKELQRMARLENIIGAIRNNLPEIPELKAELQRFLEDDK